MSDLSPLTTHPVYLAMMQAIRAAPADDFPRLALADQHDDAGPLHWPERAQFIREQIMSGEPREAWWCGCGCGRMAWGKTGLESQGEVPAWLRLLLGMAIPGRKIADQRSNYDLRTTLRRGFVSSVRIPTLAAWTDGEPCERCRFKLTPYAVKPSLQCPACSGTGHLPALGPLVCAAPCVVLEECWPADREPLRWTPASGSGSMDWPDRFSWINSGRETGTTGIVRQRAVVPDFLFRLLQTKERWSDAYARYDDPAAARLDLTRALSRWGNERAVDARPPRLIG